MSDPFVAEIRCVGFNFAPTGWAECNGQLLPISQNTALFSLLGTVYGGDGKSTFALPNLQDSAPMHPGQGQGLSQRFLGEMGGAEFVTLLVAEMPVHTHTLNSNALLATTLLPSNETVLARSSGGNAYAPAQSVTQMAFESLPPAGGSLPHNNMMPYLVMKYVIAMQGIFPARP